MTRISSSEDGGGDSESGLSDSEQLTGKDIKYIKKSGFGLPGKPSATKRKASDSEDEDELEEYEKCTRRNNFAPDKKVKRLLPVKTRDGIVRKSVPVEDPEPFGEQVEPVADSVEETSEATEQPVVFGTYVETLAHKYKVVQAKKQRIGVLASTVVEDPEENWLHLKELVEMLNEAGASPVVQRLAALSLFEVLRDVVPGYPIRPLTEQEKNRKLKKETRVLHAFEEGLLRYYKKYLAFLHDTLSAHARALKRLKRRRERDPLERPRASLARACAQCASGLLVAHPHFNFRSHLATLVVDCLGSADEEVSRTAQTALGQLYRQDRLGEAALDAVKRTKALVKSRNFKVAPRVLSPFLSLRIRDVRPDEPKKPNMKKVREKWKQMSLSERRRNKRLLKLEAELKETHAQESGERKEHFQASILQQVFWTYFHVLKARNVELLGPVLEGLARFAHLINVEFFDDLVNVLHGLVDGLNPRDTLHCLLTVFTVLSGQGEALNVDPQRFYAIFYRCLLGGAGPLDTGPLLSCFDLVVVRRRRRLSVSRLLAFLKRLATLALSHGASLSLLLALRGVVIVDRRLDVLLDTESGDVGPFRPDLGDEEGAAVPPGPLWELHLLRHHAAAQVRTVARVLAAGADATLPHRIASLDPKRAARGNPFAGLPETSPAKAKSHSCVGSGVAATAAKLLPFVEDWPSGT